MATLQSSALRGSALRGESVSLLIRIGTTLLVAYLSLLNMSRGALLGHLVEDVDTVGITVLL